MTKEVKAKLTLDTNAVDALKRVKSGFAELVSVEHQAQQGANFLKQTLATMAGVHLPQLTRQAFEFGKSFLVGAAAGYEADSAVAALVSTVQNVPWDEAAAKASGYGDVLDAIAIRTGVANDSIEVGFQRLLEIHGATAEGVARARGEIDQLATIADKARLPLEAVSQEVAFMAEGVLKTKGRLAQLLQATGVFGDGPLKKVAEGWAKLTEEQRMEILERGLERVSDVMGGMPRNFNSLLGSLANIYDITKEKLGEPLVDALTPQLERLVRFLDENRGAVEAFARAMAKDVGRWVEQGADKFQEGFHFIVEHQQEIEQAIVEAFDHAKAVVTFILDHKEALALAFGAKAVGPSALALAKPAFDVGSHVYKMGAAGLGADALGGATLTGAAGGVAALGAFALAIGGATLAVDQFQKALQENAFTSEEQLDFRALQEQFQKMISNPERGVWDQRDLDHFARMRDNITRLAEEVGESSRAAGALADAAFEAHRGVRAVLDPLDAAARVLEQMAQSGVDAAAQDQNIATIADGFAAAMKANDLGTQQYIASLLSKSDALQLAFLQSSVMTGAGFDALADLVKGQAEGFAEKLRQKADFAADKAAKPDVPKIQMNGGQTFKIQQDFRDEDPDRIAFVFRRDVASAAERRLQAVTATPFGT